MIRELDTIVLVGDLPEHGLRDGDLGAVVHAPRGGDEYEVEFVALDGRTLALLTLPAARLRPIAPREIAHARAVS